MLVELKRSEVPNLLFASNQSPQAWLCVSNPVVGYTLANSVIIVLVSRSEVHLSLSEWLQLDWLRHGTRLHRLVEF